MEWFHEYPGFIYVLATLLPLASFVLLLLAGAVRQAARAARDTGPGSALYRLMGGDTPSRAGGYVATGAIGLAFVLSVIGFAQFASEHPLHGHDAASHAAEGHAHDADHDHDHDAGAGDTRWAGRIPWAHIGFTSTEWQKDDTRAGVTLELGYRIDYLTAIMFLMVTLVAALIHLFSIGYMGEEARAEVADHQVHTEHGHLHRRGRFGRFFLYMSLFCFSMLNLVLADNFFQVFVSWELVGICSYLLIGFYYERRSASDAANKAFITNRIGDAGFIIGTMILWTYVGTLNFEDLFRRLRAPEADAHGDRIARRWQGQVVRAEEVTGAGEAERGVQPLRVADEGSLVVLLPEHLHAHDFERTIPARVTPDPTEFNAMPYWLLVAAGLGIFLGCVGKSAQFPLHVWLPDAMEGPTPVSALIHAATMVAAGVYLVGRVFPLFTPEALLVIAYTGGITLFVAATIAVVMTDIKKVLAYSTVSQLGFMMLALGVGGWVAGLLHLLTHAFFKALLFLGSGSVIYGCHHEQEMTRMGGLYPKMKVTALTMLVGVLAIAGTPFFSGWYSKDAILAQALGFGLVHGEHFLLFLLPLVTAALTTFYMFRMWFLTFTGEPRDAHVYEHAKESPWVMTVPLVVLAFFSVVVAWGWPVYDAEESLLHHFLHQAQAPAAGVAFRDVNRLAHDQHGLAELLALGAGLLGFVFAAAVYWLRVFDPAEAQEQFSGVHRFLWHKWYFDELYSGILVRPALAVANWCRAFDLRVIDGAVDTSADVTVRVSKWDGRFDLNVIDGIANLIADVAYAVGGALRAVQTGFLRNYVLFLVLATVGIFGALYYLVAMAVAG